VRVLGKYLFLGVFIIKSSENNFFIITIVISSTPPSHAAACVCVLADKILMFDAGLLFELH
jgi:hypothetical protein